MFHVEHRDGVRNAGSFTLLEDFRGSGHALRFRRDKPMPEARSLRARQTAEQDPRAYSALPETKPR